MNNQHIRSLFSFNSQLTYINTHTTFVSFIVLTLTFQLYIREFDSHSRWKYFQREIISYQNVLERGKRQIVHIKLYKSNLLPLKLCDGNGVCAKCVDIIYQMN